MKTSIVVGMLFAGSAAALPPAAFAAKGYEKLDEMANSRWALLRETERYQLNIAEKFYREQNWAVAAGEYEKFITLYESSEGSPYVQLKWANCQVKLKKLNTAIKDGYQTVIDYWPDSPEAVAASYLIGETYKSMGELPQAKAAYLKLLDKHNGEMVAILARLDLADIARIEQDRNRQKALLRELVTTAPRTGTAGQRVVEASRTLAALEWLDGSFPESLAAMETSWKEPELSGQLIHLERIQPHPLRQLVNGADTKERAGKVAGDVSDYFLKQQVPNPKDDAEKTRNFTLASYASEILSYGGRTADGATVCEKALKQFGDDDQLLQQYATVLKSLQRRDDARRAYGRMKDQIQGQHMVAYSYREEQKYLLAVPIYQDLITKDAKNATQWQYQLGDAYQHGGKYKEAIASYQQCDNFPTNLQQIASCYRAMSQFREAIGIYTQIAGGYEGSAPWAVLEIARTQEQDGKAENAIKTFQQVCKKFPKSNEASLAHQHLNNKYKITVTLGGAKDE